VQTYTGDWEDNFTKLGLPKYIENTAYGISEPVYDVKDFWSDTSSQFKGVDPTTLTEGKGFPEYIRVIAEARAVQEHLSTLPNKKLVSLNSDPVDGATFADYYQMWRDREKIVASGDEDKLKEFDQDERTRDAHFGNFSQRQFALLNEYWSTTNKKKQAEFLEKHEGEIGVNLRQDYLKSHTKENAQLAIWGQVDVLSQAAYDEAQRLIKELDIPDSAVGEYLPPKEVSETHFSYVDSVEETSANSWETQLIKANDPEYCEWAGLNVPDTPIESLELKIKNRNLSEDSPEVIENNRRIEAVEKGTNEVPTLQIVVDANVEYGKLVDEHGANSAEVMIWRSQNPAWESWKTSRNVWGDEALQMMDVNKIPVWQIDLELDKAFEGSDRYNLLKRQREAYTTGFDRFVDDYTAYYNLPENGYRRDRYLIENPDFGRTMRENKNIKLPTKVPNEEYDTLLEKIDRTPEEDLQMAAYKMYVPDGLVEDYVGYYSIIAKGTPGYEDDWFLMENRDFYKQVYLGIKGNQKADFRLVPSREVFALYQEYQESSSYGKLNMRAFYPDLEAWLIETKKVTQPIKEKRRLAGMTPAQRAEEELLELKKKAEAALAGF